MYLLDSQQVMDLISRDENRPIFKWIINANPSRDALFVSIISIGQVADTIESLPKSQRNHWRRLLKAGQREFKEAGSLVEVDMSIVDTWRANLRGAQLASIRGSDDELGEDDRIIIATAIARNYSLVTERSRIISEIAERTSLTLVEL